MTIPVQITWPEAEGYEDCDHYFNLYLVSHLPRLIEQEEFQHTSRILETLFWRTINGNISLNDDPKGYWGEPTGREDLDACTCIFLKHLRQAQRLMKHDKTGATNSFILCVRLLPVLVGAALDELCRQPDRLRVHEPMYSWCTCYAEFEAQGDDGDWLRFCGSG